MRIFRIFWGVYCFIVLAPIVIFTALFILTTNVIFGKRSRRINLLLSQKISCVGICYLSGIFLKVIGKENFEPNKGYVIIGNHNSNYDIFINSITLPWDNVFFFLSKAELGKVPVFSVVDMKSPIIVSTLVGMRHINNPNYKIDMAPGFVRCYFEKPIDTSQLTAADIPALKEQVRNLMLSRLIPNPNE